MNWQEILIILVPILGLMSWVYTRIEKKLDHLETKLDHLETKMNTKFDDVIKVLHSLDMRLTRLEGRFDERGYWESRKTGTHDDK